jgi:hypothetical protein
MTFFIPEFMSLRKVYTQNNEVILSKGEENDDAFCLKLYGVWVKTRTVGGMTQNMKRTSL